METRNYDAIREEIENYLSENTDKALSLFNQMVSEDGTGQDDEVYSMNDFDEICGHWSGLDLINRAFYGGDDDTEDANGIRGDFNPNRSYFYFDGYGNLVSTDYPDNHLYYIDEIIDHVANNRDYYWIDSELEELFDELENA